ncbi:hypothetical protein KIPB_007638, partial [Kipferlia bialata]
RVRASHMSSQGTVSMSAGVQGRVTFECAEAAADCVRMLHKVTIQGYRVSVTLDVSDARGRGSDRERERETRARRVARLRQIRESRSMEREREEDQERVPETQAPVNTSDSREREREETLTPVPIRRTVQPRESRLHTNRYSNTHSPSPSPDALGESTPVPSMLSPPETMVETHTPAERERERDVRVCMCCECKEEVPYAEFPSHVCRDRLGQTETAPPPHPPAIDVPTLVSTVDTLTRLVLAMRAELDRERQRGAGLADRVRTLEEILLAMRPRPSDTL